MRRFVATAAVMICIPTALLLFADEEKQQQQRTMAGKVTTVSQNGSSLTVKDYDDKSQTFQCNDQTRAATSDGQAQKVADIKEDTQVAVTYTERDGSNVASSVNQTKTAEGKISNASRTSVTITDNSGNATTMSLAPGARIMIGSKQGRASDLQSGAQATAYYWSRDQKNTAGEIRAKE